MREEVVHYLEPDEILAPSWSFVLAAQADLADTDTLSLANELYDPQAQRQLHR
jgi:hypothetical protein